MTDIFTAQESEFEALTDLWEASVSATHGFLQAADIAWLRPRVRHDYLCALELRVCKNATNAMLGFIGVSGCKVEMLFVAPQARGQGIGKRLLQYAIAQWGISELDVNEQNPQAIGFYQRQGFVVVGRSPLDGLGKPFPLLHMRLAHAPKGET